MTHRLNYALTLLLTLFLAGCSLTPSDTMARKAQYWPEPPTLPRFVHEFTLRNSLDIHQPSEEEKMQSFIRGTDKEGVRLGKPFALVARQGRIYITDTAINQVHVFDIPRSRYFRMGYRFEGKLGDPKGIALDQQGFIYVVDGRAKRVVVYDAMGLFSKEINLGDDVTRPTGIAVTADGSALYVVDTGGIDSQEHRVIRYAADGTRESIIGTRGSADGEFNLPVDAALGIDGLLYVLDAGNFRVQVFDQGQFVHSWGSAGSGPGQLARPRSISTDAAGNIYVSDTQFTNVQLFNPQGQLLLAIGKRGFTDADGELTLVAGITVDETGRLFIIDQKNRKIEVYRPISAPEGAQILEQHASEKAARIKKYKNR